MLRKKTNTNNTKNYKNNTNKNTNNKKQTKGCCCCSCVVVSVGWDCLPLGSLAITPQAGYNLEIVRLGIPRLGTWRKQKQGSYEKAIWPPMALTIGLLGSSALQNDGRIKPVTLQCRGPLGGIVFFLFVFVCAGAKAPVENKRCHVHE